jgi:hypothetical protein
MLDLSVDRATRRRSRFVLAAWVVEHRFVSPALKLLASPMFIHR